jgi:hypothetical protein
MRFSASTAALTLVIPLASIAGPAAAQVTFSDLIHHWPADGNAEDSVGGADGVLHGAVTFGDGQFGQAFECDGGHVTFGKEPGNFGTSDFTISFWFRTDARAHMALISKRAICNFTAMIQIRIAPDGDLGIEFAGISGTAYSSIATTDLALNDGVWHHVAFRRSGVTHQVYVDGCVAAQHTAPIVIDVDISA